jgi:hypothetical protein
VNSYELYERAWAAGFFDGEGCTTITGNYLRVEVKQVDLRGLARFHAAVHGLGTIIGEKPNIHRWYAYSLTALEAMQCLWPFLGDAKREQFLRQWDLLLAKRKAKGLKPISWLPKKDQVVRAELAPVA